MNLKGEKINSHEIMISRNWEDLWVVTNYNFRTFVKELPTTICQLEIFTVIRISTLQGKPPNSSFLCNLKPMKIVILHVRRTPLNASKLLRLHPCDYHSLNQTWVLVIINHQGWIDYQKIIRSEKCFHRWRFCVWHPRLIQNDMRN